MKQAWCKGLTDVQVVLLLDCIADGINAASFPTPAGP
jgi:hypothetical protein